MRVACAKCGNTLETGFGPAEQAFLHRIPDDIAERCLSTPPSDPDDGFSCADLDAALEASTRRPAWSK